MKRKYELPKKIGNSSLVEDPGMISNYVPEGLELPEYLSKHESPLPVQNCFANISNSNIIIQRNSVFITSSNTNTEIKKEEKVIKISNRKRRRED